MPDLEARLAGCLLHSLEGRPRPRLDRAASPASGTPTASSRRVLSTTSPSAGAAAPTRPVFPPCGTIGTPDAAQASTTSRTSPVSRGRTTASGRPLQRPVQSVS